MAKAQFHKGQRVFVRPVGTWATVEAVLPHWSKGLDEPLRIHYDCGLGREFAAEELDAQTTDDPEFQEADGRTWRVIRARNRWQGGGTDPNHPHPGTYPVVVTAGTDWGGWRVPAAEYDLYPLKIEQQARIMSRALDMLKILAEFVQYARAHSEDMSDDMLQLAGQAAKVIQQQRASEGPREASSGYSDAAE